MRFFMAMTRSKSWWTDWPDHPDPSERRIEIFEPEPTRPVLLDSAGRPLMRERCAPGFAIPKKSIHAKG